MKTHVTARKKKDRSTRGEAPVGAGEHQQARIRRILRGAQLKVRIGAVDDPLEREAEGMAAEASAALEGHRSARAAAAAESPAPPRDGTLQRQPRPEEEEDEELLQARFAGAGPAGEIPDPEAPLKKLEAGGYSLPGSLRRFFEGRWRADLSGVRVHAGAATAPLAAALQARAFTLNRHLVFAPGEYAPHTPGGRRLLAHELAHVLQQGRGAQGMLRRSSDFEDPTRFRRVHQALFQQAPSGGTLRPWVDPDPAQGVAGTAEEIKNRFIAAFRAHIQANPMSVGGTVPTRTTESQAETTALAVDEDIRNTFAQITAPLSEAQIRAVVAIIQPSQTSDPDFLNQWLENRLSLMTDIDEYDIRESDPRYRQMLADLLSHSWAGPRIRTLASRQAAFVEAGTRIFIHRGAPAALRRLILIHELTHFYAAQGFKDWVDATSAPRFYNEGFTEYLARKVMTSQERNARTNYQANVQAVETKVVRYVPDADIAQAYFQGEVWRLEANSAVARQLFETQVGLRAGAPRSEEVARAQSSTGIVQTVAAGAHYRFMNLGVNQASPKPEHEAFFRQLVARYVSGHPDVRLRFVGHASATGSDRLNRELSRRRAEAFYQMARDAGVPESQLIDAAIPPHSGEAEPTAENSSVHGRAFNRRVELFMTGGGA